ncbi:MAG: hypothetical protein LBP70_00145 [Mycoplasmataceae bacterium]|jgi:hypothetical protein|nr:hypothetical protein [Mycoplasmataceae bacterium]
MNKESKAVNLFIQKVMENVKNYSPDFKSQIAGVLLETAIQLSDEPITLGKLKEE